MAHYLNIQPYKNGYLLLLDDGGTELVSGRHQAEQRLLSSIHCWAGVDSVKAREEMALLTKLMRLA